MKETSVELSFREAREYIRNLKFNSLSEYREWIRSEKRPKFIPVDPKGKYPNEFISTIDWIGAEKWLPYEEAKKIVRRLDLSDISKWVEYSKSKVIPKNIPRFPPGVYKEDWKGWGDFLGNGKKNNRILTEGLTFKILRAFARGLRLKSSRDYKYWARNNLDFIVPISPNTHFKEEWVDWQDFLDTRKSLVDGKWKWKPFVEAREFVRSLELNSYYEYSKWCQTIKRPSGIPSLPSMVYNDEWVSWYDWLGKDGSNMRTRICVQFKEAREFARSLSLNSSQQWKDYCHGKFPELPKKPDNMPIRADQRYKEYWISWSNWLGSDSLSHLIPNEIFQLDLDTILYTKMVKSNFPDVSNKKIANYIKMLVEDVLEEIDNENKLEISLPICQLMSKIEIDNNFSDKVKD